MKQRFLAALHSPTGIALLLANLFPLAGVLFWGWEVFPLMLLFWLENVVVGIFNLLRILLAGREAGPFALKLFLIPFFTVHYGMFTLVHGIFVFALFGGVMFPDANPNPVSPEDLFEGNWLVLESVVWQYHLQWAVLALFLSHGFSFVYNYLGKGEYRRTNLGQLMSAPYHRVIVLHVVILAGGFCTMLLGAPILALALLVVLKTTVDLVAHQNEHAGKEGEAA